MAGAHTRVEAALGVGEAAAGPWVLRRLKARTVTWRQHWECKELEKPQGRLWPPDSLHHSARFQADRQQGGPSQQHMQPVHHGRLLRREGVLHLCRLLLLAAWAAACIAGAWGLAGDHRAPQRLYGHLGSRSGSHAHHRTHTAPATSVPPSSTANSNSTFLNFTSPTVDGTSPNSTASSSRAGEWGHHRRYERRAGQCWSRAELPCYNEQQQHGMSEQLQVKLRQYHTYRRECLHREPLHHLRSTLLAGKPTACRYLVFYHPGPAAVLCEPFEHGESWVLFGREEKLEEHHAQVLALKVAREWREVREGREKKGKKGALFVCLAAASHTPSLPKFPLTSFLIPLQHPPIPPTLSQSKGGKGDEAWGGLGRGRAMEGGGGGAGAAEGGELGRVFTSSGSSSSNSSSSDGSGDDYGLEGLSGNVTEVMVASLNAALVHNLSVAVTGNMSAVRVSVGHDATHAAMGVILPPINSNAASPALPAAAPAPMSPDVANSSSSNGASDTHVHIVRLTIDEKQNNGDKAGVDRAMVDIYTLALFSDALIISEVSTFGYLCASLFGVPRTTFVSATCKRAPPEPCLHFPPGNERCPDGQAQVLEQALAADPHVPLMHCVDVRNGLTLKPLEGWE
ncbi:unnamed protein product [Closterium sp. NIES-64]|nr:unnamed protein product [Closterium sp. NIES-64]